MFYFLVFLLFVVTAFVTSTLRYTLRAWRWGMAIAVLGGAILIAPTARLLQALVAVLSVHVDPVHIGALAVVPFAIVLLRLWVQRRSTPRYIPGPDDDPVLRRFRAEKLRRRRLQRQEEEAQENASATDATPTSPHAE